MRATNPVEERLPNSLAEAPEHLTLIQTSYALGLSLENVRKLEASDDTFPKRRRVTFSRTPRFLKVELVRWMAGQAAKELTS